MQRSVKSGTAIGILSLVASLLSAQDTSAPLLEASLFKNGMAYLVREVEVPGPGSWKVSGLPTPVHGTFWILPASPGLEIQGARAFQEERPHRTVQGTLGGLLALNVGKKLELKTADGWISGEILPLASQEPPVEVEDSSRPDARTAPGYAAIRPRSAAASVTRDYFLWKTDKGVAALRIGEVQGIRSASGALTTEAETSRRVSSVQISTSGGRGKVRLVALTRGLSWAPSYVVDISDPRLVVLRGKAVVMNDAEDLKDVRLNLIAGFPNIQFEHAADAFSPTLTLPAFLRGLEPPSGGRRSPVVAQQAILSNVSSFGGDEDHPLGPVGGESRQDLFLHPLPGISLKTGERGYHPLFEARAPYRHLHVWEIGDALDDPQRWREEAHARSRPASASEEVWHELAFRNGGKVPWSTGPAMTIQEGRLLGQDTLHFTPVGGEARLRITRAMEVVAEQKELEVARQREATTPYSGHWDLVTVKGELQVSNRKREPVNLVIRKRLSGELGSCEPAPAVETLAEDLKTANPRKRLTWDLPLEAGGKLKLTYTYKLLVAR